MKTLLTALSIFLLAQNVFAGCGYVSNGYGGKKYVCTTGNEYSRYSQPSNSRKFKGYGCVGDCSGHEAGYEWAKRKGISSASECGGSSLSFVEGCQAAAQ